MIIKSCIPIIPSADLEKSLRFWVDALGLTADQEMRQEGRLVGCMVHNEHTYFWLNQRAGEPIPEAYHGIATGPRPTCMKRGAFKQLGYEVSEIVERDYGQTEFFLTDVDGYSHCFGVATKPE